MIIYLSGKTSLCRCWWWLSYDFSLLFPTLPALPCRPAGSIPPLPLAGHGDCSRVLLTKLLPAPRPSDLGPDGDFPTHPAGPRSKPLPWILRDVWSPERRFSWSLTPRPSSTSLVHFTSRSLCAKSILAIPTSRSFHKGTDRHRNRCWTSGPLYSGDSGGQPEGASVDIQV